jgi:acyl-CoA thioester hydrolase
MSVSCLKLRVRYAETDQMGVAHHASYFVWMEAARTELLREKGMPYRELERRGYFLPVREAHCRYRKSLQYDDSFYVESKLTEIRGASIKIEYTIYLEARTDNIFADGYSLHAFVDGNGGVLKVPDFFKKLFL